MFDVLVYVYENYWQGAPCPDFHRLGRKLTAAGFDAEEIEQALEWLDGLNVATQSVQSAQSAQATPLALAQPQPSSATPQDAALCLPPQSSHSLRVYSVAEQEHLGAQSLGFVSFLAASGVLPPHLREIVMDRAMAAPGNPLLLDDLKIIVLMVYWSFGEELDVLVLDELCDDTASRLAH
ncbi:protein Smg [Polaromonas sp.]|nr:protein Smg [Polaromonas sp.]